jgi:hypothetical protein
MRRSVERLLDARFVSAASVLNDAFEFGVVLVNELFGHAGQLLETIALMYGGFFLQKM